MLLSWQGGASLARKRSAGTRQDKGTSMDTPEHLRNLLLGCVAVAMMASAAHAQIYKWVDADGRTHFSDRIDGIGAARSVEVKQAPQSASSPSADSSAAYWQEKERQFRERQVVKRQGESEPRTKRRPESLSHGKVDDGSDAARCNLAKDVLSGAVRHPNGAPTDAYDRQVAEHDVRAFCR